MNTKYKVFITVTFFISVFFLGNYIGGKIPKYEIVKEITLYGNSKSWISGIEEKHCESVTLQTDFWNDDTNNFYLCYTKEKVRTN